MDRALNIGKPFGIQLRIHYSWFFIFVLLLVALVDPNWSSGFAWGIGITTCILFFASVVAHELAHSLVGRANGIPVTSITLFLFGGMAMMTKEASRPEAELKMAAAGPICSAVIGGICFLVWHFAPGLPLPVSRMFLWLMIMNFALAIFNLIPGFPLDGGRVFRAFVWRRSGDFRRATRIATNVGKGVAYAFIGGGITVVVLSMFGSNPLELNWFSGVWIAFIGWFLLNAAQRSYQQSEWKEALKRFTVSQVMSRRYSVVAPDSTLTQLVDEHVLPSGHRLFVVAGEGRFDGILTLDSIKAVPRTEWDVKRVRDIMTPFEKLMVIEPEESAVGALERMNSAGADQILVLSEGRAIGLVTRDSLTNFIRVHSELGLK